MTDKNPYTREFGSVAETYIVRTKQWDDVARSFIDGITDDRAYFIVGQRGFGKSSFLRSAKSIIDSSPGWIVIELRSNNPDLIHEFAASMYAVPVLNARFTELELDFSLIGIGISFSAKAKRSLKISSDEVAVKKMLEVADKLGIKVLVALDEITNTPSIRDFCGLFNVCKGDGLPLYLLMDGLYKNTNSLENAKELTFLKRVQKLKVDALDISEMTRSYIKNLNLIKTGKTDCAKKLAEKTKGYPYAFQLTGYYTWLWLREDEKLLDDYDSFENRLNEALDRDLISYVYSTLWSGISPVEKDILAIMAKHSLTKVKEIREKYNESFPERAELTSSNFSKYRDNLIRQDILRSPSNTILEFALPRFDTYVQIVT